MNSRNKKVTLFVFVALLVTTNAFTMDPNQNKQAAKTELSEFVQKHKTFSLCNVRCKSYKGIIDYKVTFKPEEDTVGKQARSMFRQFSNLLAEFKKSKHDFILPDFSLTPEEHEMLREAAENKETKKIWTKQAEELRTHYAKRQEEHHFLPSCFPTLQPTSRKGVWQDSFTNPNERFFCLKQASEEHRACKLFTQAYGHYSKSLTLEGERQKKIKINEITELLFTLSTLLEKTLSQ